MAGRVLPVLPQYRKDGVTRRFCATVHLYDDLARDIDRDLTGDRLTAIGLTLGINFVAVARHARAAVRRRKVLDRQLAVLGALFVGSLLVALWSLLAGHGSLVMVAVYGPAGVLVVTWGLVRHTQARARGAAQQVYHGAEKSETLAPPVEQDAEARLHELKRSNVLPYADETAFVNPFVGSGTRLQEREIIWGPIDVSEPAEGPGGTKLAIADFDAIDLHTYVARQMESISGLDGLRTRNRLYVVGSNAYLLPELVPDRTKRPNAHVSKLLVQAGLEKRGAGMRTHLCLERVGEGGRLIVSMYLRAILAKPSLSWEVAAYAIPPLEARFYEVGTLPLARFDRWWSLFKYATTHTWPELSGAPSRMVERSRWLYKNERALRKLRRKVRNQHLIVDYGAATSLRELHGDWEQAGYAERMDALDYLVRLQQGVLTATERFLKDHNVDTSSFDNAQKIITQNYHVNNVNGPAIFGAGGTQHNNGPQGGGPQGGSGGGGGGKPSAKP
ncbi:LigA protein [Streptomyces davaonensis JCM 4913]|uniref:LigA protein n=1 Tax=Streptomyces davaonensis (strain DSM 101723 / JCM 4913 / KCC S-0913 / 768) TaxID=1214101 RepID=K4QTL7_STRDJ|nr:LigA protein [Streptomyces davaonensis JCM 4913]